MLVKKLAFFAIAVLAVFYVAGCGSKFQSQNNTVPLRIDSFALPTGYVGSDYTPVTLTAIGGSGSGFTWAVSQGSLPAGLTLSSAGALSGKPTAAGNTSFSVTVTDSQLTKASAQFSVTVKAGVAIGTAALPDAYVGVAYSHTVTATGGTEIGYTWALASGSTLPDGLTFSAAGVLSGTPTTAGTSSLSFTVTDSANHTGTGQLSISVKPALSVLTAPSLPPAFIGAAYFVQLQASGGSGTGYTWTIPSGAAVTRSSVVRPRGFVLMGGHGLPDGLSLSSEGVISGTPTTAGTSSATVMVTDSAGNTATFNLSITVSNNLTITTAATLPTGQQGDTYSTTFAATGGSGTGYTWSVSPGTLLPSGLTLSTDGVLSGTLPSATTYTFGITVTDSDSNTASGTFSLKVSNDLRFTTAASLVETYVGADYAFALHATGGSGQGYIFTVASGSTLPGGVLLSAAGVLHGTPTTAGTFTFSVKVTDSISGTATKSFSLTIGAGVTISTTSLPGAYVGTAYLQSLMATGGTGSGYIWTVTSGGSSLTALGLALSNGGVLSGTPLATGSASFTVSVTDTSLTLATASYTLTVSNAGATFHVSGQISLRNGCGSNIAVPPITLSINTSPVQTATSDSSGNYSFNSIPNGTYTITPSIANASSMFTPAWIGSLSVNGSDVSAQDFSASIGFSVSGTVSYAGSQTGTIYLTVNSPNCGSVAGTSIAAPGAFTIRGVPPGAYSVDAWIDAQGFGYPNNADASGLVNNVSVASANVTGKSITMNDPATYTITGSPTVEAVSGLDGGVVIKFQPIIGTNGHGMRVELPTSYTLQWSTDPTFASPAPSSFTFPAGGTNGTGILFLNSATAGMTGSFANGTVYYLRMRGALTGSHGPWTVYGGGTPTGVTVGAPTGGNTVTGTVTFSATPTGPLTVGFFDQSTGMSYSTVIPNPVSPQAYTVQVPTGSNYVFFADLDQNNNGMIDPGDITNVRNENMVPVAISANTTQNLTLNPPSSTTLVTTNFMQVKNGNNTDSSYGLAINVKESVKLPVAVALVSGPGVLQPVDMVKCLDCGTPEFRYSSNFGPSVMPKVGDAYGLQITYSDGSTDSPNAAVTGVLDANALATLNAPTGNGVSSTPDFDWTYPANAANYSYQFAVWGNNGGNIWQIPSQDSNTIGFTDAQVPTPLVWGTDPTNANNAPNPSSLSGGSYYTWQIQAQDANGNTAQAQMTFSTTASALTLPTPNPNSLPSATVNASYNGSITASGGLSPYQWTVVGLPDDNLNYGVGNNSSTLSITGTPNSVTTAGNPVSFQVTVQDSNGQTAGPVTYTIAVNSAAPVSLPDPTTHPLSSALINTAYTGGLDASGGPGGTNYTFVVNGTPIPTNGVATAFSNGGGLKASNNGGNNLNFSGTPTAAGDITLVVEVIDAINPSDTASQTYTVTVVNGPNGVNNGRLNGTYACLAQGFNDSDGARWASAFSLLADGNGNLTNGVWNTNGRFMGSAVSGTLTGTYSIGADNNGLLSTTSVITSGGSGSINMSWVAAITSSGAAAQTVRLVENDDNGTSPSGRHGSAKCYLASPAAFANGTIDGNDFAFGVQGEDGSGIQKAYVGRFTASGGALSKGHLDGMKLNDSSATSVNFTGTNGSVDANGRFTLTFNVGGGSNTFIAYIVDANRMFMVQTDANSGLLAGEIRRQQNTGTYSNAGLSGGAVIYTQGSAYSSTDPGFAHNYASHLLQVSGAGDGTLTVNKGFGDENGTYVNNLASGAVLTATFDSSNQGRATMPAGTDTVFLYFYDTNNAFYLSLNAPGEWLETGWMQQQTQATFTNAAVAGTYMMGQLPRLQSSTGSSVGQITLDNAGNLSGGISDAGQGSFSYVQPISGTYTWDSATYGSVLVQAGSGGKGGLSCVIISATNLACTVQSDSDPSISILQQ